MWKLVLSKKAKKQLGNINAGQRRIIERWLAKNIDGCKNPRAHGRALLDDRANKWRHRIGIYRAICHIEDNLLVVLAIEIGHRRSIY